VSFGDTASLDAFSRLRTSNAVTLFDSQFQYDLQPQIWEALTTTSGQVAHAPTTASATLTVTATATDVAALQTYQYFRYQPGKSQLVVMTFLLGAATTNVTRRVGYFDANNGLYLQQTGDGLSLVRRSGGVDATPIPQASWNLDSLDGNGPSGLRLDVTKTQILFFDFQWLGVGRVRFGFDIDGHVVYVHEMNHANLLTQVYMLNPNLPLRFEIRKTALAGTGTLMAICAMVASEGGFEVDRGYSFSAQAMTARTPASRRAIVSIRPRLVFGASNIPSRGFYFIEDFDVALEGSGTTLIEIVYNPTYTTASGALTWTNADTNNSQMEYSIHGDANAGAITGGTVVHSYITSSSGSGAGARGSDESRLSARSPIALDAAGTGQRGFAIVCTNIVGTPAVRAVLNWKEIR
jgi:hypothetical protein